MVAQFVFLFLTPVIFWETLTEIDVNTVNVIFFFIVIAKSNLTWPVLISTIELTSKCLKRWSENTRLRLLVPLEFWTFWRDFYGRYEYRSWKIVVELLTLGRTLKFHTPTVVQGRGRWWNSSPDFLICCSISKRFCLRWKASDLLNKIRFILWVVALLKAFNVANNGRHLGFYQELGIRLKSR